MRLLTEENQRKLIYEMDHCSWQSKWRLTKFLEILFINKRFSLHASRG
jgi:hypothetical protein